MTSETTVQNEQETRRQAMLQAMQIDVWLPRQQLLNAAPARDYLLEWQAEAELTVDKPAAAQVAAAPAAPAPQQPAASQPRTRGYVSVHDKLAALQAAQTPQAAPESVKAAKVKPSEPIETVTAPLVEPAAPVEPIPRFVLQLLRAGSCLLLADLPVGEPFQARDPDYQLLRDMLRAAELTDQPSFLRQGAPIRWPLLQAGSLMHEQNAAAARSCVRDLLSVELAAERTVCIWLLGEHAVRFASADDHSTQLYTLKPFLEGVQLWCLPGLEVVLQQPLLKREIWHSMCQVRSLWQEKEGG
ncbi:MAG TPA: hypothetical protein VFD11_08010 [Thiopseudomonas sp.]|nr:hypothetical protein [Thiopseudomonas sp.]